MKILIVNCVYAKGSTGKIVRDLQAGLQNLGHEVLVAYGRGGLSDNPYAVRLASPTIMKMQSLASKVTGMSYECSPISTSRLKKLISKWRPDVVNLHCINANTVNLAPIISYLKKHNIATVVSAHAEFFHTGGCGYALTCNLWKTGCSHCPQFRSPGDNLPSSFLFNFTHLQWKKMKSAFSEFNTLLLTGVSNWLTDRMKQSPFFTGRTILPILNGLNTEIFHHISSDKLRNELGLNEKKVVVHVTPDFYIPIKGGRYVIETARRFANENDYVFLIIGYNGNGDDLPPNVIALNHTSNQTELAQYYSMADVCLLTSEKETFSMVTAESLCCGTPVVGFKAGAPETICIADYCRFSEFGDVEQLCINIKDMASTSFDKQSISDLACQKYSIERMTQSYLNAYNRILKS